MPQVHAVQTFSAPEELIICSEKGMEFDAVFLDLALAEQKTGIQVAEVLYRISPETRVIYVTGFTDRFVQHIFLHKANVYGFLTKPVNPELLFANLQKLEQDSSIPLDVFSFRTQSGIQSVARRDILYLESKSHLLIIHTTENEYTIYEKLSAVLEKLSCDFVQCHKSFAVNLRQIQRISAKEVRLKNGTVLPVSRAQTKKMKDAYLAFIGHDL